MSIFHAIAIACNIIFLTVRTVLTVFGLTLPMNVAYFLAFCEVTMSYYFLLNLIEISWLKYFYKYVWKSVRPLDEGFVVSCFTLNNIAFSTLLSGAWLMSGRGQRFLKSLVDPLEWHITFWINESVVTPFR